MTNNLAQTPNRRENSGKKKKKERNKYKIIESYQGLMVLGFYGLGA